MIDVILTMHRHKKSIYLHAELFVIISQQYTPIVQIIEFNELQGVRLFIFNYYQFSRN